MEVYTIGFSRKPASEFFGLLKQHGIKRLIDVRLHNSSQLAGYTKKDNLAFFLNALCNADYDHELLLAPTDDLLRAYRKRQITWSHYEQEFFNLLASRRVENRLERGRFSGPTVLLCSERTPDRCHRRLVLEYLNQKWGDIQGVHL